MGLLGIENARGNASIIKGMTETERQATKIRGGLTARQYSFAMHVANGETQADAYRKSYNCENMADATLTANASRLASDARVRAIVEKSLKNRETVATHDVASLRTLALNVMVEIASNERAREADRLKAVELIGRVRNVELFENTQSQAPQGIAATGHMRELEQRLRRLMLIPPAIKVEPTVIIEQSDHAYASDLEAEEPDDAPES